LLWGLEKWFLTVSLCPELIIIAILPILVTTPTILLTTIREPTLGGVEPIGGGVVVGLEAAAGVVDGEGAVEAVGVEVEVVVAEEVVEADAAPNFYFIKNPLMEGGFLVMPSAGIEPASPNGPKISQCMS